MIVWMGPKKFRVVACARSETAPRHKAPSIERMRFMASCRAFHSDCDRRRYFSVTISRIGPTFCAIPPWTSTKLSQILLPRLATYLGFRVDVVVGQQPAAADAKLRIVRAGQPPFDHLDPGPDPAGVLPAAAGTAQPLAEDRAGGDQPPLRFLERPVSDWAWPVARIKHGDQGRQEIGGDGQPRSLGDVVDGADDLQPQPRPHEPPSRSTRLCPEPSSPGGTIPAAITAALSRPR